MFLREARQIIVFIDLHCVLDSESQNRVVAWFREKNDWIAINVNGARNIYRGFDRIVFDE